MAIRAMSWIVINGIYHDIPPSSMALYSPNSIFLSSLMSYHVIYILFLGTCILFYFLGAPPLPLAPHSAQ